MLKEPYWNILLGRFIVVFGVLLFTYNTSGYSYFHWVKNGFQDPLSTMVGPIQVAIGLGLAGLFFWGMRTTYRAKGPLGVGVVFLIFSAIVLAAYNGGYLDIHNSSVMTYVIEVILAFVLAIGTTLGIFKRKRLGTSNVDDADTESDD